MLSGIQFSSFSEFLNMGGYAFNIWSVYLLFSIFVVVNLLGPIRRHKQLIKNLQRQAVLSERKSTATDG